jgi:energy-coupling factor transporter ATP-binding protein EcfA2
MPLLRLIAEGVGPFERLDVDLSDGKGNPHLGPHIFAGKNGSGKSTVLRTLAWVMEWTAGFRHAERCHFLADHRHSRAMVVIKPPVGSGRAYACALGTGKDVSEALAAWSKSLTDVSGFDQPIIGTQIGTDPEHGTTRLHYYRWSETQTGEFNTAAYSPSRALRHLAAVDLRKRLTSAEENSLAFESTIQNDFVQSWLLGLYSKRAIARDRRQSDDEYARSLERFENALQLLYDGGIAFDVELEPNFQPRLKAFGRNLDFSQLPDGMRSTVGWIADFMMRQDLVKWDRALGGRRPGVLLLDEVDAHLHPLWQRKLLPAMRKALPDVQILVTSHSPFVISSCPGSRVHVLELDDNGRASVRPPVDSPIGESVTTTLKEIFGVDSRFDVQTERELDEWNTLKRREVAGSLSALGRSRLKDLTVTLAERSEELKSIVASPRTIPESVLRSLTAAETPHQVKRKKRA